MSDSLSRKIKKIIDKYNFDIRLVNKPAKKIAHSMNQCRNRKVKHMNCDVCNQLPNNYMCSDRFLVYKFTCVVCNEFYIGQTSRSFTFRYKEHMSSLNKKDKKSALSQHSLEAHNNLENVHFTLDILERCSSPLETRLREAKTIDLFRPSLNRKHEKTW